MTKPMNNKQAVTMTSTGSKWNLGLVKITGRPFMHTPLMKNMKKWCKPGFVWLIPKLLGQIDRHGPGSSYIGQGSRKRGITAQCPQ
jgi:hypothetical protein